MSRASAALGVILGSAVAASAAPPNAPAMPAPPAMSARPAPASPTRMNLADTLRPDLRDAILKIIKNPTVTTKAVGEEVVCTVAVYEWLFDHPDRVALAWQRLKVPSVTITDLGGGKFGWGDENGSEIVWETAGTFPDGRVWYATGKVKAAKAAPSIPVQAVIVVSHPKKVEKDGVALFTPTAQVYLHSDSRAANLLLRSIGPAAPKLAEDSAVQLLEFFGGIAAHVQKNPKQADTLLGPPKK